MPYDTATLVSQSPGPDGDHLVVEFTGPSLPPAQKTCYFSVGQTAADLKEWARGEAARLNRRRGVTLTVGQSVDLVAPAEPARTAFEIWVEKARRLIRLKQLGLTNITAVSEVTTLEADVNATYQSGYAGQF